VRQHRVRVGTRRRPIRADKRGNLNRRRRRASSRGRGDNRSGKKRGNRLPYVPCPPHLPYLPYLPCPPHLPNPNS